jgi:hypothetical protein
MVVPLADCYTLPNRHIAAFAVASLAESLTKSCKKFCPISTRRSGAKDSNQGCSGTLLGVCRERPIVDERSIAITNVRILVLGPGDI